MLKALRAGTKQNKGQQEQKTPFEETQGVFCYNVDMNKKILVLASFIVVLLVGYFFLKPIILLDSSLKPNSEGYVQTYIVFWRLNSSDIQKLEKLGVQIEIINQELKIVQAEIPFKNLQSVVRLINVLQVKSPEYLVNN